MNPEARRRWLWFGGGVGVLIVATVVWGSLDGRFGQAAGRLVLLGGYLSAVGVWTWMLIRRIAGKLYYADKQHRRHYGPGTFYWATVLQLLNQALLSTSLGFGSGLLHIPRWCFGAVTAANLILALAYSVNYVAELRRRAAGDPAFAPDEPDETALGRAAFYVSPGLPGPLGPWRRI